MEHALELFGYLILTILGFVLPLVTILFSFFPEGTEMLATTYEKERNQSEKSIIDEEIKKRESEKGMDYIALEKTLKTLKQNKKRAETKLSLLNPQKLIIRISTPLIIAFITVIVGLQNISIKIAIPIAITGIVFFLYALRVLWLSFNVLSEVSKVVSDSKKSSENKIIELLSTIAEKSGVENLFLKPEKILIKFNNEWLKENAKFAFSANKTHEISLSITNTDELMARKLELGFVFPLEFLIDKTSIIDSVYAGEDHQIVRFKLEFIQTNTNHIIGKLGVTFLKTGEHKVRAFIKGENIKNKQVNFQIAVLD